jgi:hypothetical protein
MNKMFNPIKQENSTSTVWSTFAPLPKARPRRVSRGVADTGAECLFVPALMCNEELPRTTGSERRGALIGGGDGGNTISKEPRNRAQLP